VRTARVPPCRPPYPWSPCVLCAVPCARSCVRAHERLGRDLAKKQEDDRDRRLNALRANDFEAYQELLKQQQVRPVQW
jgi:hypothetical protein